MTVFRKHSEKCGKWDGHSHNFCMKCHAKRYGNQVVNTHDITYEILNPFTDIMAAKDVYKKVFSSYAWPGGYTIVGYDLCNGDVFCVPCAKKAFIMDRIDIALETYDEGPSILCANCGKRMLSSYGPTEDDRIEIRRGDCNTYLICHVDENGDVDIHNEKRTILIQTDYEYPAIASLFGWQPCHNCTDGTIDCSICGKTTLEAIQEAKEVVENNIGITVENPGYIFPCDKEEE